MRISFTLLNLADKTFPAFPPAEVYGIRDVATQEGCKAELKRRPDLLHERNNVDEELFGEFGFSEDHESFEHSTSTSDEFVDGALRQSNRVTQVYCPDVVHLALRHQRVQYLSISQSKRTKNNVIVDNRLHFTLGN